MKRDSHIGATIKTLREQAAMSTRELARRVGVSHAAISAWESGRIKSISADHLFSAAEALGVDPQRLVTPSGPNESRDPLTKGERTFLQKLRSLSDRERKAVAALITALSSQK